MSARSAQYLRVMLTPRNDDRTPADVHPSIAALSPTACHLWEVLSNLAWHTDNAAIEPVAELARRMHLHPANVRRARAELVRAGVIAVDEGGGRGNANRYRFPLAAPVEDVHNPRADARVSESPTRAPARGTRAVARDSSPTDPLVTYSDAVPRGADEPPPDDQRIARFRAVIDAAAADERRRIGEARYRQVIGDD